MTGFVRGLSHGVTTTVTKFHDMQGHDALC